MDTGNSLVQGNQDAAAKLGITLPGVGSGMQAADVAGNQAAAARLGVSISGVNGAAPPPKVPQTQDANAISNNLSGGTTAISTPAALPAPHTNGTSANTSVPSPIPAADSIVNDNTPSTPAQTQQKTILDRIAGLVGQQKGKTALTNQAESAAGIPALQKSVNDLNTQLEGLNNQALDLQNQAAPGGAIENQNQQNAFGRGITAAGLAPMTAGDLRKNQIQQSAVASQALTLKSAIYGAQGNLTLAKDAADKAALAQFEDQQNQIDTQKAQLDALMPQLTKDEKNQALIVQTKLQDRQRQLDEAKDDKKTIIAMATAVLQGQPNNPQAHYAAQQALAESNKEQPDLQKVLGLIGGYQTLDTQLKVAQLAHERAATAHENAATNQINEAGSGTGGTTPLASLPASQQAALKASGFTSYNSATQGLAQQLATGMIAPSDLSKRSTGTSPYSSILSAADAYSMATTGKHFDIAKAGIQYKYATNVQTQNTLNFLGSLIGTDDGSGTPKGGNLDQLIAQSDARTKSFDVSKWFHGAPPGPLPALNKIDQWAKLETGDPQIAAYHATLVETSDQIAKILQGGGSGSGTSDAKLAQAQALFDKGFTPKQISAVAGSMKGLLINRAAGMTRDNPYLADYATQFGVSATGKTGTLDDGTVVTQNADGSITDAKGNKYDANGKRL